MKGDCGMENLDIKAIFDILAEYRKLDPGKAQAILFTILKRLRCPPDDRDQKNHTLRNNKGKTDHEMF